MGAWILEQYRLLSLRRMARAMAKASKSGNVEVRDLTEWAASLYLPSQTNEGI